MLQFNGLNFDCLLAMFNYNSCNLKSNYFNDFQQIISGYIKKIKSKLQLFKMFEKVRIVLYGFETD